ncbi:MAG: Na/Pi cotransporter family protein [Balneolaceae bacterium]|nr:MAG: Na/Pi cotransporter family protein [Balneolaceae bacterium]
MLSEFELWVFLAGLGMFLFGMHMMEESIRLLSGSAFRSLIRKYTGTRLKAVGTGMVSTAILQSSSAVSLMALAFVGAGIMNLTQAVSVMMGTKIGTTATAWIVAVFGFKFNIDAFSLPLIGIGGLGMILLAKSPRYVNISKFLVAFGFLFMGLDYMKGSVDQISDLIDPSLIAGYGVLVFALVGLVMTAIMQSSSATIAIVLTMLFSGLIDFQSGAAMVIGANVGTTVTVLLGSIGGIIPKKQAALSQLIFTVSTAVITLVFLPFLTWLVLDLLNFNDNLVLGLALFHSIFNVIGVILFLPFIQHITDLSQKAIPESQLSLGKHMQKTDPSVTDAGLEAFRKEIIRQLKYSLNFVEQLIFPTKTGKSLLYSDLERYHAEIFEYYTKIVSEELDPVYSDRADLLLRSSRNIMNAVKNIYEIRIELDQLKREGDSLHLDAFHSIAERLKQSFETGSRFDSKLKQAETLSSEVDLLHKQIEEKDREFIKMCTRYISSRDIKKVEITFLLMLNRVVTQSSRMLVFTMKTLLTRLQIDDL